MIFEPSPPMALEQVRKFLAAEIIRETNLAQKEADRLALPDLKQDVAQRIVRRARSHFRRAQMFRSAIALLPKNRKAKTDDDAHK